VGHVTRLGEMRNALKMLVGTHGRKRPLGIPRHISEDDIKTVWESVDSIHLA
jgi:hypothetical protein